MSVIGLDGQPKEPDADYDVSLLDYVRLAEERIRRGGVVGVAVILVTEEDGKPTDIDCSWHGRKLSLLSGCARMAHRINLSCDEVAEIIS